MFSVTVKGGEVEGEVFVSGSKNAFFPALASAIAVGCKSVRIENVPHIADVKVMLKICEKAGMEYELENGVLEANLEKLKRWNLTEFSSEFGKIRGSVVLFGAMLARFGRSSIPYPGGCSIGKRPIDQHIHVARELGIEVEESEKSVTAKVSKTGKRVRVASFRKKTVTGTENALFFACALAKEGVECRIENCAREPEVEELIKYLKLAGIRVEKEKDTIRVLSIDKVPSKLTIKLPPDRIEASTWFVLAGAVGGKLKIKNVPEKYIESVLEKLEEVGVRVEKKGKGNFIVKSEGKNLNPTTVVADSYPSFPTDVQPQFAVLLTKAKGKSIVEDRIFPERFSYLSEIRKMGGKIRVEYGKAVIFPSNLKGAEIVAHDLRGAAALFIAGLCAQGYTKIHNAHIILRGYENFFEKLSGVGAKLSVEANRTETGQLLA